MRRLLERLTSILAFLAMAALILWPNDLKAQVTPLTNPSSILILEAEGYDDILETNDQLYLIVFDIFYADADDRPSENARETMVVHLTSSSGTHGFGVPVSFVHRGYIRGTGGMYFPASDSDLPTWTDSTLVAQIVGNPALTWASGQPVSNQLALDFNTAADSEAQQAAIVTFLRGQVPLLENNWFEATATITDLIAGQPAVLTATGEEYFQLASPDQRNLTPDLYAFNVENPDIISYGRTMLTAPASATDTTITVSEAARTGLRANQDITIIGSAVWETVTVSSVVGDVITFAPSLANSYSVGDQLWIVSQVFQSDVDTLLSGSFFATIMTTGVAATGMSVTMFGTLLGLSAAIGGGGVIGFAIRGYTAHSFAISLVSVFMLLMLFTIVGFVNVVAMGLFGTIMALLAVWQTFWRY